MTTIGLLIGFVSGVMITIFSEVVKIASNKKLAAAKLYPSAVLTMRQILEADWALSYAAESKRIYTNKKPSEAQELLEKFLSGLKAKLTADKSKALELLAKMKNDPIGVEKQIFLMDVTIEQYKKESLLISKQELSYLSPKIQPLVMDLIENYYSLCVDYKFLMRRVNEETLNQDQCIEDLIAISSNTIKLYRDREAIFVYSAKIINQGIIKNIVS